AHYGRSTLPREPAKWSGKSVSFPTARVICLSLRAWRSRFLAISSSQFVSRLCSPVKCSTPIERFTAEVWIYIILLIESWLAHPAHSAFARAAIIGKKPRGRRRYERSIG